VTRPNDAHVGASRRYGSTTYRAHHAKARPYEAASDAQRAVAQQRSSDHERY